MRLPSEQRIREHLLRHEFLTPVEFFRDKDGINILIEWGDWKHDHARMDRLMSLMGMRRTGQTVTDSDGGDSFSAIHTYLPTEHYDLRSAGDYSGGCGAVAKAVRAGDAAAIEEAARLLLPLVPDGVTLIPMPSHTGGITYTGELCRRISAIKGVPTAEALTCIGHVSMCQAKKDAKSFGSRLPWPEELMMSRDYRHPVSGRAVIVDNVIASGTTAVAAINAFGKTNVMVLAVAEDKKCEKIPILNKNLMSYALSSHD